MENDVAGNQTKPNQTKQQVHFRLNSTDYQAIASVALDRGESVATIMRRLVRRYLVAVRTSKMGS